MTSVETEPLIATSLSRIAGALEAIAYVLQHRYLPPSEIERIQKEKEAS